MTSPESSVALTPPAELELVRQVGQTTVGTLWTGRLDGAPVAAEVLDLAAAQRAGLDPGLLEVLPTLTHPALAPPTAIATSRYGPALLLAAAIGRPLLLPGQSGELTTLLPAATRLAAGLAALHDAGLTHNAITASLLCPGPDGGPQLAVVAAAATPGDRQADVQDLITALAALDPAAAAHLTDHLSDQNYTGPEPARALLEQLHQLAAVRRASDPPAETAPPLAVVVPTVRSPDPLAARTSSLELGDIRVAPGGAAPAAGGGMTRPAVPPARRARRPTGRGRDPGRPGRLRQLLVAHPILLGGGAALVALLAAADVALAASGHHRTTAGGRAAAPAQPTPVAAATPSTLQVPVPAGSPAPPITPTSATNPARPAATPSALSTPAPATPTVTPERTHSATPRPRPHSRPAVAARPTLAAAAPSVTSPEPTQVPVVAGTAAVPETPSARRTAAPTATGSIAPPP